MKIYISEDKKHAKIELKGRRVFTLRSDENVEDLVLFFLYGRKTKGMSTNMVYRMVSSSFEDTAIA